MLKVRLPNTPYCRPLLTLPYTMYMADQTARLCAGQSHENTDYYRTIALIEQRSTSRECRVLLKCGLWDPATVVPRLCGISHPAYAENNEYSSVLNKLFRGN